MKARISKKQRFFNQIKLTKDDELYIGIDVHKTTYHVALYLNDAHAIDFITPADNIKVCTTLKKLEPAIKTAHASWIFLNHWSMTKRFWSV